MGSNKEELVDYFLTLSWVIFKRTEQYIQTQSIDPLEYCQRQLEGNLDIIAAFV